MKFKPSKPLRKTMNGQQVTAEDEAGEDEDNSDIDTPAKEWLLEQLKDLDFAAGYITEAIEEGEAAFLLAVRDVVEAQGGIGELAKGTSLNRKGLYDMLSEKGNLRLSSLSTVFNDLGLQIAVTKKEKRRDKGGLVLALRSSSAPTASA